MRPDTSLPVSIIKQDVHTRNVHVHASNPWLTLQRRVHNYRVDPTFQVGITCTYQVTDDCIVSEHKIVFDEQNTSMGRSPKASNLWLTLQISVHSHTLHFEARIVCDNQVNDCFKEPLKLFYCTCINAWIKNL